MSKSHYCPSTKVLIAGLDGDADNNSLGFFEALFDFRLGRQDQRQSDMALAFEESSPLTLIAATFRAMERTAACCVRRSW